MGMTSKVKIDERARELFLQHRQKTYIYTDRLFVGLMIFQWIGGIILALWISPKVWAGQFSQVHIHVWAAIGLGGLIAGFPILLGIFNPGAVITRYVIAVSQMLFSALLIHLTGGRIETHFHVFGSLAFLAFYRDWKVLVPATVVVAADHFFRGFLWPQSVYGIIVVSPWRWVEHASWVIFEDIFLISSCQRSVKEMQNIAERTAELEASHQAVEEKVVERTAELVQSKQVLEKEVAERERLENVIVQSEKMAAVGQLAAGVAHEINNPTGFINSNLQTLEEYFVNYNKLWQKTDQLKTNVQNQQWPQATNTLKEIDQLKQEINFDFMVNDTGNLIKESQRGTERISRIVMDLRTFAREGKDTIESIKVNEVIDSILSIVHNELKYKAELKREYGEVPLVKANPQKLGQVFINLLVNALQAIEQKGIINIRTYAKDNWVCAEFSDTGKGIPPENLKKIFDPFFTTKPVGQGTGLGLSVSYDIIKKQGGEITVESEVGKGTTFTVKLPLKSNDQ